MSEFQNFRDVILAQQGDVASAGEVFHVNASKDDIWQMYLDSFPKGTNKIQRERTEHDCSTCRSFIKNVGGMVSLDKKGNLQTIWDVAGAPYPYDVVAAKMAEFIRMGDIDRVYRSAERGYGVEKNAERDEDGNIVRTWHHLHCILPSRLVTEDVGTEMSRWQGTHQVLSRGLAELKLDAVETVVGLFEENAIYHRTEHKAAAKGFLKLKKEYLAAANKEHFVWSNLHRKAARFRNTAVGVFVTDLSDGKDLDTAVKLYESKVAPANYKRTSAVITPSMVKKAVEKLRELGLEHAIQRRHATIEDIPVSQVDFADRDIRPAMKDALTDLLMGATKAPPVDIKGALDVDGATFLSDILPGAEKMQMLFERKHLSRLMSLTAPVEEDAGRLFQWDNGFSWTYVGNLADSAMTRAVVEKGGRVDGVFRFTHSWNHDDRDHGETDMRNASLMDLHVFLPNNKRNPASGVSHDRYGNDSRVGWNHRKHVPTGGVQDVDYTPAAAKGYVPVENITFPNLRCMPEGRYVCQIHNWQHRAPTKGGFRAEIAFGGQVFEYSHPKPLKHKEWVTVATVTLKNGKFEIDHHIAPSSRPVDSWGLTTGRPIEVQTVMQSPNFWGEKGVGNRHHFFMLKDCRNPDKALGFFNENLDEKLYRDHRKVFEVLASKTKIEPAERQLSGVGLSPSRRDSATFIVQKDGSRRTYNVQF